MFAHGETVAVLTAGTVADPYSGDDVASWETSTSVNVPGVGVEPRPSQEPTQDARNAVVSGFTLYFPPDTQVSAANKVRVRGNVYDVIGDPADWRNPFTGWTPGIVVQVGRTEG